MAEAVLRGQPGNEHLTDDEKFSGSCVNGRGCEFDITGVGVQTL